MVRPKIKAHRIGCILTMACVGGVVIAACGPSVTVPPPTPMDDTWSTVDPASVGLDQAKLDALVVALNGETYPHVHGVVIIKEGHLAFESYFEGHTWAYGEAGFRGPLTDFDADTRHNLASVTKSFTSALIGIAIDRGYIDGVGVPVVAFFPEYAELMIDGKEAITLEHLLTMSSGLAWDETSLPYSDPENSLIQMFSAPDPLAYVLEQPLVAEPGTTFLYNSGGTNVLGVVIEKATGQRMDDFAETYLFGSLGITDYAWDYIRPDLVHASGNLKMRPRDMAKFGYVFLKGGLWRETRLVSETWVEASTRNHIATSEEGSWSGYGYQWWLGSYQVDDTSVNAFHAAGWGGQRIVVFSDFEMVVVFTGGNYVGDNPVDEVLVRYVLPAAF